MKKVWYRKSKYAWFATLLVGGSQKQIRLVNTPHPQLGPAEGRSLPRIASRAAGSDTASAC